MPKLYLLFFFCFVPAISHAQVDVSRRQFLAGLLAVAAPKVPLAQLAEACPVAVSAAMDVLPLKNQLLAVLAHAEKPTSVLRRMAEHNLAHRLTGNAWNLGHQSLTDELVHEEFENVVGHLATITVESSKELGLPLQTVHLELCGMIDDARKSDVVRDFESFGYGLQDTILNKLTEKLKVGHATYGPGGQFMNDVFNRHIRSVRPGYNLLPMTTPANIGTTAFQQAVKISKDQSSVLRTISDKFNEISKDDELLTDEHLVEDQAPQGPSFELESEPELSADPVLDSEGCEQLLIAKTN